MRLVAMLEDGRNDFLEAIRSIPEDRVALKPSAEAWSLLDCVEHVIAVEERHLSRIANGTRITPKRDPERETKFFTIARNRITKIETPDALQPAGRFQTRTEALVAFELARKKTLAFVREQGEALYAIGANHPYFGKLNGAEMVCLIDAHARRHAEQIRELAEPQKKQTPAMKSPKVKKPGPFKRDKPDLPAEFDPSQPSPNFEDGELISLEELHLQDIQHPSLNVHSFRLAGCILERVQLAESKFGSAVWKDVRLIDCDLANIRAHRLSLVRVEFINCRLTGLTSTAADFNDVLIQNTDIRYAQLQGAKVHATEFQGSNLQESDLQNADLAGCILNACNLTRADLRGAKLQSADLRNSELETTLVEINDVRGAIVDPAQAMILARLLGIQIL